MHSHGCGGHRPRHSMAFSAQGPPRQESKVSAALRSYLDSEGSCFQTHSGWLLNSVPCDCATGSPFPCWPPHPQPWTPLSHGEASSLDALPQPESHLPGGAQSLLRAHLIGSRPQRLSLTLSKGELIWDLDSLSKPPTAAPRLALTGRRCAYTTVGTLRAFSEFCFQKHANQDCNLSSSNS